MSSSPILRLHLSQREKLLLPLSLWFGFLSFLDAQFFCLAQRKSSASTPNNNQYPVTGMSELSPGEPREKSLLPASHQLRVQGESSSPFWGLRTEDRLQGCSLSPTDWWSAICLKLFSCVKPEFPVFSIKLHGLQQPSQHPSTGSKDCCFEKLRRNEHKQARSHDKKKVLAPLLPPVLCVVQEFWGRCSHQPMSLDTIVPRFYTLYEVFQLIYFSDWERFNQRLGM